MCHLCIQDNRVCLCCVHYVSNAGNEATRNYSQCSEPNAVCVCDTPVLVVVTDLELDLANYGLAYASCLDGDSLLPLDNVQIITVL